jgi:hypothetical protein
VRHFGVDHFQRQEWAEVRQFEAGVWVADGRGGYLLDIIDSVVASGFDEALAVSTSMHDLLVVSTPVSDGPMDVLAVRAPTSLRPPEEDSVLIEYMALSGRNTSIGRPQTEAVPLFWRFVKEEFGIAPTPS